MTRVFCLIIITCFMKHVQLLFNVTDHFSYCDNNETAILKENEFCYDKESCANKESITNVNDEFHFVKNQSREYIVYSVNNQLFQTICEKVQQIIIQDEIKSNVCVRDLFVAFKINDKFEPGFLTKNGIIRKKTIEIECSNSLFQIFEIPNKSHKIMKINNSISISFVTENLTIKNSTHHDEITDKPELFISTIVSNLNKTKNSLRRSDIVGESASKSSSNLNNIISSFQYGVIVDKSDLYISKNLNNTITKQKAEIASVLEKIILISSCLILAMFFCLYLMMMIIIPRK